VSCDDLVPFLPHQFLVIAVHVQRLFPHPRSDLSMCQCRSFQRKESPSSLLTQPAYTAGSHVGQWDVGPSAANSAPKLEDRRSSSALSSISLTENCALDPIAVQNLVRQLGEVRTLGEVLHPRMLPRLVQQVHRPGRVLPAAVVVRSRRVLAGAPGVRRKAVRESESRPGHVAKVRGLADPRSVARRPGQSTPAPAVHDAGPLLQAVLEMLLHELGQSVTVARGHLGPA
jgi:hypothetical protein